MKDETKGIIIGVVSGAVPFAINLINSSPKDIFINFDIVTFLGSVVQVFLLMLLGGFIVFINKETNLYKAFQLAIAAPAIIIGLLNGNALNQVENEVKVLSKPQEIANKISEPNSFMNFFISSAYAQEISSEKNYLKEASGIKRFWYGLTGNLDTPWFVIAGSHKTKQAAEKQVQELKNKGYDAKVYDRFRGSQYYGVMIGSYLSLQEAEQLRKKAIEDGLPKDIYLWKWK
jgi:hypothetical protein